MRPAHIPPWNKGLKGVRCGVSKGNIPWNKGKKGVQDRPPEVRTKISEGMKGKSRAWLIGRYTGDKCVFWKGGVSSKNVLIRSSYQYADWRKSVFERDNYTCQICNARGVKLHADHIKPFAYFPELRFDITNGRTLCVPCHKETDTYLQKSKKYARI